MVPKPNFRSNAVSKVDLTSTLQRGAISRLPEPTPIEPRPTLVREETTASISRRQLDTRKKKLAHLKTLLEYEEKKDITAMLREIADAIGHNIQFSVFNRSLLLAALAQKDAFLRVAEKLYGWKGQLPWSDREGWFDARQTGLFSDRFASRDLSGPALGSGWRARGPRHSYHGDSNRRGASAADLRRLSGYMDSRREVLLRRRRVLVKPVSPHTRNSHAWERQAPRPTSFGNQRPGRRKGLSGGAHP
jgi:hypothetical protein